MFSKIYAAQAGLWRHAELEAGSFRLGVACLAFAAGFAGALFLVGLSPSVAAEMGSVACEGPSLVEDESEKRQRGRDPDDPLVPAFLPALVALLIRAEQLKGAPLTEREVLRIRDGAGCVMVPLSVRTATEADRGYADLDPDAVWEDWQEFRQQLSDDQ